MKYAKLWRRNKNYHFSGSALCIATLMLFVLFSTSCNPKHFFLMISRPKGTGYPETFIKSELFDKLPLNEQIYRNHYLRSGGSIDRYSLIDRLLKHGKEIEPYVLYIHLVEDSDWFLLYNIELLADLNDRHGIRITEEFKTFLFKKADSIESNFIKDRYYSAYFHLCYSENRPLRRLQHLY